MENRLKILGRSPATSRDTRVVAECGCGVIKTYRKGHVQSGATVSCGCGPGVCKPSHRMCSSRLYRIWESMKGRCTNPNNNGWNRYGGRGITVCDRWMKFENFYEDMGDKPERRELDRIDNNKGYSPDNCRWVTRKENNNNKENSIKIEFGYMQLTIAELAELGSVSRSTMRRRWYEYGNAWKCLFPTTN